MTVLDDGAGDLEREVGELRSRLAERDAELAEALNETRKRPKVHSPDKKGRSRPVGLVRPDRCLGETAA